MRPTPHTTLQNHFEIYFWLARNFLQGLFVLNTFCVLYPQTTVQFPQTSKMTHACLSSNTDTFPSFSKQNKIKQHTKKKQTSNNNKTKQKKNPRFVFSLGSEKEVRVSRQTYGWLLVLPYAGLRTSRPHPELHLWCSLLSGCSCSSRKCISNI